MRRRKRIYVCVKSRVLWRRSELPRDTCARHNSPLRATTTADDGARANASNASRVFGAFHSARGSVTADADARAGRRGSRFYLHRRRWARADIFRAVRRVERRGRIRARGRRVKGDYARVYARVGRRVGCGARTTRGNPSRVQSEGARGSSRRVWRARLVA